MWKTVEKVLNASFVVNLNWITFLLFIVGLFSVSIFISLLLIRYLGT